MMEEILKLMGTGQILRVEEIAEKLDIPEEFALAILEDLDRRGYLENETPGQQCPGGCPRCSTKGERNHSSGTLRRWSLTEKTRRTLHGQASR